MTQTARLLPLLALAMGLVCCDKSPEEIARADANARYEADMVQYREYVKNCQKKNGDNHFGPMIGFVPIGGRNFCRSNGVVCTSNNTFQADLKKLWDEARSRGACIIWKHGHVGYGGYQTYPAAVAFADDGKGERIAVGLSDAKKKKK
ncbi:MAG TPA: hypothetical protein VG102_01485 [Candidatus Paceibacterota bacterium]|jgi:hypothetical protein|nr:hypothetical protein [Candidatus Paceibacterota bacterium]